MARLELVTQQAGRDMLNSTRTMEFVQSFVDEQVHEYERRTTDEMKKLDGSVEKAKQFAVRANVYETLILELRAFADRDE